MKILMVCLGTICRSPMAEGILRRRAQQAGLSVTTDSAGTSSNHVGQAPDQRATQAMRAYGIDITDLRARQFNVSDLDSFDRIFAMDSSNLDDIRELAGNDVQLRKVSLLMDLIPNGRVREVPDPYYGGQEGFDEVFRMLDQACSVLVEQLRTRG
ncbi:MAG: low molecular weight phosphotyrosine protein phosphatase [Flavobacteriales bacterium]|nr:low molecular weight phosphotyrosine protein phosphatase [Flavobacteriales bacterium]